ncbi:phosphoglycerate mutase-like protein [Pluteus cervinus]|uniref:Phosphoglycerate mutase-like protein n=1 Tax=Pluteus cervinus TaxID=181527 RepID=A0ACD3A6W5_9AGAR|nr:phosphoglycerate mutase-like protein [Pluteus cervinus]
MVTFTLIRHAESTDNVRAVWAGWKDATLTNHGMNQAKALGTALSSTQFTTIYASPLQRALDTAKAIQAAQTGSVPPLITSILLREQHFGQAEGKPYGRARKPGLSLEEHFAQGIYPSPRNRAIAFPEGESLNDLAERVEDAIDAVIVPELDKGKDGNEDVHIAIVSHGLFLAELLNALLKRAKTAEMRDSWGMKNTGWTRLKVDILPNTDANADAESSAPRLQVRVFAVNQHSHLDNLVKQRGIGSAGFDPKQRDIRGFFGGKSRIEKNR